MAAVAAAAITGSGGRDQQPESVPASPSSLTQRTTGERAGSNNTISRERRAPVAVSV